MGNNTASLRRNILEKLEIETRYTQMELEIIFNKFLKNYPGGTIKQEEFENVYKKYFQNGGKYAVNMSHHVFRVLDINKDGKIDFREFIYWMSVTTRGEINTKLLFAFMIYDMNNDSKISFRDVKSVIRCCQGMRHKYDMRLSEQNLKAVFDEHDLNHDGFLDFDEFKQGSLKNAIFVQVLHDNLPEP